jgi:MFS family permease
MGWRWIFWLCAIFMGVTIILMILFLEETKYIPPPLNGCEVSNREEQDQPTKVSTMDRKSPDLLRTDEATPVPIQSSRVVEIDDSIPMKSYWERHPLYTLDQKTNADSRHLWRQVYQPFQILATFPAVMFAALQYGFAIAMLAILAVTQTELYAAPPYNFSSAGIGNMNLPPAIGAILGSLFGGPLIDYFILQIAKRRGGIYEPETRLWLFLVPGLSMTIGALMYGLTIDKV